MFMRPLNQQLKVAQSAASEISMSAALFWWGERKPSVAFADYDEFFDGVGRSGNINWKKKVLISLQSSHGDIKHRKSNSIIKNH